MNKEVCALCGKPATAADKITREHHPPKQFYPKSMRNGLNLWTKVPTHKSCNGKNKLDEEYFYHATYPLVANANPAMAAIILDDLKRRAKQPQTQKLLRGILRMKETTTPGGLTLPRGMIRLDADEYRLQQVAIKIGRCLFYRDHGRVLPYESCKDIRLCECEDDVPEMYEESWRLDKINLNEPKPQQPDGSSVVVAYPEAGTPTSACQQVFSYRTAYADGLHFYTLMFWEAFAFCMVFEDPTIRP
jgi:hypothetical protein